MLEYLRVIKEGIVAFYDTVVWYPSLIDNVRRRVGSSGSPLAQCTVSHW